MVPYIKVPDLPLGPELSDKSHYITLHPFGILVATGVLVGTALATRRARLLGYDSVRLNSFVGWMLVAGFIGGHVLDELFYHWPDVVRAPLSLVMLWTGLSSFGGFTGALIGIVLWKFFELKKKGKVYVFALREKAQPILPFADLVLAVFPVAWIFGRAGCSTVHDHPGARAPADALLAVAYPSPDAAGTDGEGPVTKIGFIQFLHGHFPRYDLGFLELLFTIVLAGFFALTWRRRLPVGSYVIAAALAYAPVRFVMDFLRIPESERGDTRYAGLTPAQWCCVALFAYGLVMVAYLRLLGRKGVDLAEAVRERPPEPTVGAGTTPPVSLSE